MRRCVILNLCAEAPWKSLGHFNSYLHLFLPEGSDKLGNYGKDIGLMCILLAPGLCTRILCTRRIFALPLVRVQRNMNLVLDLELDEILSMKRLERLREPGDMRIT